MAKDIITLKVEVNDDVEAYFLVNKIQNIHFLTGVKVKEAKYKNKTVTFAKQKDRQRFLK